MFNDRFFVSAISRETTTEVWMGGVESANIRACFVTQSFKTKLVHEECLQMMVATVG